MEEEQLLKADGFDEAILGVGRRCGQPNLLVYDYHKCCEILVKRDKMTYEEAEEFMEFNVVGAWVGDTTPIFVHNDQEAMFELVEVELDGKTAH
jgi:hypothetical protein